MTEGQGYCSSPCSADWTGHYCGYAPRQGLYAGHPEGPFPAVSWTPEVELWQKKDFNQVADNFPRSLVT